MDMMQETGHLPAANSKKNCINCKQQVPCTITSLLQPPPCIASHYTPLTFFETVTRAHHTLVPACLLNCYLSLTRHAKGCLTSRCTADRVLWVVPATHNPAAVRARCTDGHTPP